MLKYLTVLLVCQLLGEVISRAAGLPVPGPVIGMALLFVGLMLRGGVPDGLRTTAGGLLDHLGLLFVPAGVGVMLHLPRLADEYPAIVTALIGSTLLAIVVTGVIIKLMSRSGQDGTTP
ncbi:MAG: CidA/LrgA family protein [Rhodospirillales bacterium]|nr:MAG: CidA/LrgA family protein [Rhodospirillales bacterium]